MWVVSHWGFIQAPLILFVASMTFPFPAALAVRGWIVTENFAAVVGTVLAALIPFVFHAAWWPNLHSTFELQGLMKLVQVNNGYTFGLQRKPTRKEWHRQHKKEQEEF
mmetsp:Transcript_9022/g.12020  ORF Transcript_9022/g.12020 Transcript_9022/m.12020 type:complete len:108 (+) Transcript_9022:2-325(+)